MKQYRASRSSSPSCSWGTGKPTGAVAMITANTNNLYGHQLDNIRKWRERFVQLPQFVLKHKLYYGRNLLTWGACSSTSDTMLTGWGSFHQRNNSFREHNTLFSKHMQPSSFYTYSTTKRNTADPYDTMTELSPINSIRWPISHDFIMVYNSWRWRFF